MDIKNKIIIVAILLVFVLFITFCKSENNDKTEDDSNTSTDLNQTDENTNVDTEQYMESDLSVVGLDNTGFYEGSEIIYKTLSNYLNSFDNDSAPSGLEFTKQNIELTSFLNKHGIKDKSLIKTDTYMSLYNLLSLLDKIYEKNRLALLHNSHDSKSNHNEYVKFYHDNLGKLNELLDNVRVCIDNDKKVSN